MSKVVNFQHGEEEGALVLVIFIRQTAMPHIGFHVEEGSQIVFLVRIHFPGIGGSHGFWLFVTHDYFEVVPNIERYAFDLIPFEQLVLSGNICVVSYFSTLVTFFYYIYLR